MLDRYIGECMVSTSIMLSKNLPMGIKIVISVKHWYVVGVLHAKVEIVFDIHFSYYLDQHHSKPY